jgi:hypothetical protein
VVLGYEFRGKQSNLFLSGRIPLKRKYRTLGRQGRLLLGWDTDSEFAYTSKQVEY